MMSVYDASLDLEAMDEGGCRECAMYSGCSEDAIANSGFSTGDVGRRCKGYERKEGER